VVAILAEINGPGFNAGETAPLLIADAMCETDTLNDEEWSCVPTFSLFPS
jgi:hypothetical protein